MALQVTHLSVALTIGGNHISLVSEGFPSLSEATASGKAAADKAKAAIKERIDQGVTFSMEPGVIITTSVGHIIDWIKDKYKQISGIDSLSMPALVGSMRSQSKTEGDNIEPPAPNALNGLIINLWGLSLSTKGNFTFNMKLQITNEFYQGIGIPPEVTNIITVDSLGIGIVFNPSAQSGDTTTG